MGRLFALLVGIDQYPRSPLKGCVNDSLAWKEFLEYRAGRTGAGKPPAVELLLNEQATRRGVLDAFRRHLGQAGEGDTALFCFSGHGSEEKAPLPYALDEPGGVSETLVAYDSRLPGGLDLADKELAVLIAEVARRGAHVAVVLDSCHSGTATRALIEEGAVRRMRASGHTRAEGSYWFEEEGSALPPELGSAGGWRVLPRGRHVLLAACEDYQTAKECTAPDGTKRGLFSYFLLEGLARLGPGTTYREAARYAQVKVHNLHPGQNPQAEGDLEHTILDGAAARRPGRFHVELHRDGTAWLDGGAVHGVEPGAEVAVLSPDGEGAAEGEQTLATARVAEVEPGRSRLELAEGTIPSRRRTVLPARLRRLPTPQLLVHVAGEAVDEGLEEAIEGAPLLALASSPDEAHVLLTPEDGLWRVRRPGATWDLVDAAALPPAGDPRWTEILQRIARWHVLAGLSSPGSTLGEGFEIAVCEWLPPPAPGGEPDLRPLAGSGELVLPYREELFGRPEARRIALHLVNRSPAAVYYNLLALDEDFGVDLLPDGSGRLPAGAEVWIGRGEGISVTVPDRYNVRGVTRRRDLLVGVLSTAEVDCALHRQEGISATASRSASAVTRSTAPAFEFLESFLQPVRHREIGGKSLASVEWTATRQALVSVRPTPWTALPGDGLTAELAPGVRVQVPAGLRGQARLHGAPVPDGARALQGIPPEVTERLRPVSLVPGFGSDPGPAGLELQTEGRTPVPSDARFLVEGTLALPAGERLVAVAWNGAEGRVVGGEGDEGDGLPPGTCHIAPLPAPAPGHESVWLTFYGLRPGTG